MLTRHQKYYQAHKIEERERKRIYYQQFPQLIKHRCLNWRSHNLERWKAYCKTWRQQHLEYFKSKSRKYREENHGRVLERRRELYAKNPKHYINLQKRWAKLNPVKINFRNRRQQSRRKGASGFHTLKQWEELIIKFNHCCLICGKCEPEIKLTEDHILSITKGGSDFISNIQPLCRSCNARKGNKTPTLKTCSV